MYNHTYYDYVVTILQHNKIIQWTVHTVKIWVCLQHPQIYQEKNRGILTASTDNKMCTQKVLYTAKHPKLCAATTLFSCIVPFFLVF